MSNKKNYVDLKDLGTDTLKSIILGMDYGGGKALQYMSKSMRIETILRESDDWIDFKEDRNPRFFYLGEPVKSPRKYEIDRQVSDQWTAPVSDHVWAKAMEMEGEPAKAKPTPPAEPEPKQADPVPVVAGTFPAPVDGDPLEAFKVVMGTLLDREMIAGVVVEEIEKVVSKPIVITFPVKEPVDMGDEMLHEEFETCLALANAGQNIWLYGDSGAGKTMLAKQVAKALSKEVCYTIYNAETELASLFGYLHPTLGYIAPDKLTKFEAGDCVHIEDEIGRAIGQVVVGLNSMANENQVPTPLRLEKPMAYGGEGNVIIACDNEKGDGVSDVYTTDRQDAAFLNRFRSGYIEVKYSKKLEKKIAKQYQQPVATEIVWAFRKAIKDNLIHDFMGTRQVNSACEMLHYGADAKWVVERFLAKFTPEEVAKVKPYVQAWL